MLGKLHQASPEIEIIEVLRKTLSLKAVPLPCKSGLLFHLVVSVEDFESPPKSQEIPVLVLESGEIDKKPRASRRTLILPCADLSPLLSSP